MSLIAGAPSLMHIAGAWVPARSGAVLESIDPTTEEVVGILPAGDAEDVDDAVAAASRASAGWRDLGWAGRAHVLTELADAIAERREELADLDVMDAGLPLAGMLSDVDQAAEELRFFAGIASQTRGTSGPASGASTTFTVREPYGVVGRIVPFNHPFKFAAGRCAAPLAVGNTVVLKPGEHSSLSALALADIAQSVLPPGVLNVVTGVGASVGAALAAHPGVPRVAFTGSVEAGRAVLRAGAEEIKHVTLELGGKNPVIIFPDVDVDEAARAVLAASNMKRSNGQSCGSGTRIYVHRDVSRPFLAALVDRIRALVVGDPREAATDVGPMAFRAHYERVLRLVEVARAEGATVLTGGGRPAGIDRGYFVAPTVLSDLDDSMTIVRTEVFGPVISVLEWSDVDDVIARANRLPLGLTALIWTNDVSAALRTAYAVEAGYVSVNGTGRRVASMPFGGWKRSGIGQENGIEELQSFTREKVVSIFTT